MNFYNYSVRNNLYVRVRNYGWRTQIMVAQGIQGEVAFAFASSPPIHNYGTSM